MRPRLPVGRKRLTVEPLHQIVRDAQRDRDVLGAEELGALDVDQRFSVWRRLLRARVGIPLVEHYNGPVTPPPLAHVGAYLYVVHPRRQTVERERDELLTDPDDVALRPRYESSAAVRTNADDS